ncbi:valine--tRNA ligase [Coprothermobacteraceae bacterium]|nr:valine--tRNA ligase [Coprothermobacteraceae bacterium]
MNNRMEPQYNPEVEAYWSNKWKEDRVFASQIEPGKPRFSMVIPPPNVTGSLHIGHALNLSIQDAVIRHMKMKGLNVCWVPGTDHAGIATQNVVERDLLKEGISRHDIGREEFLKRVWDWKEKYGNTILNQITRLGCGVDWERLRFTMDPICARAVRTAFKRLFDAGLIYKGKYLINWCPRCGTALSDLEVVYHEEQSNLWYIRYPFEDGKGFVVVATTRPETMLGDTAVAVHPEDPRYQGLVGKTLVLPLVGRRIPLIADEVVDPEFGTGAVKVTPAHDPTDFEIGRRHNLEAVQVVGFDGTMTDAAGEFSGLDRFVARQQIVQKLAELDLLEKVEPYVHSVGHCQRCDTVVEPMISDQWFVKLTEMAPKAREAVATGKVQIVPERWAKVYLDWIDNIRDWCISRQIWWGHRIPVYTCTECGHVFASEEEEVTSCPKCGGPVSQEEDVLDTWFSSALWPFEVFGWPEKTEDLSYYYPTSLLVTGYDILFFWVARMVFMAMHLTDQVPFEKVYLHGLVRDEHGQKMSKSKGNTVDPMEMIDEYSADALRYALVSTLSLGGQDINFSVSKVEHGKNFTNKIWNSARYVLGVLEDKDVSHEPEQFTVVDQYILTLLEGLKQGVTSSFEEYDFGAALRSIEEFYWSEYCDWYLEMSKVNPRPSTYWTLRYVLEESLKLLHPFLPFVTQEVWSRMGKNNYLVQEEWPKPRLHLVNDVAVQEVSKVKEAVRGLRNLRAEIGVKPGQQISVYVEGSQEQWHEFEPYMRFLARVGEIQYVTGHVRNAYSVVAGDTVFYVPLEGLVDVEAERKRLSKKKAELESQIRVYENRLNNENFLSKAPREVVEKQKEELGALEQSLALVNRRLEELEG